MNDSVGSLLHYAVILSNFEENSSQQQNLKNYLETIETLIGCGSEVNLKNKFGETPLHLCRNSSVVDLLLNFGAQMNVKEITGKTPLFTYICRSNYESCLQLLKHGSEVEINDRLGNSLIYVVAHSNAPIQLLVLLLEAGINLNKEPWFDQKLFPSRLKKKYPKLVKFMEWRARNPLKLKELCRKAIRNHLYEANRNKSVISRVQNLPVPVCLRDYMLFNLNIK